MPSWWSLFCDKDGNYSIASHQLWPQLLYWPLYCIAGFIAILFIASHSLPGYKVTDITLSLSPLFFTQYAHNSPPPISPPPPTYIPLYQMMNLTSKSLSTNCGLLCRTYKEDVAGEWKTYTSLFHHWIPKRQRSMWHWSEGWLKLLSSRGHMKPTKA